MPSPSRASLSPDAAPPRLSGFAPAVERKGGLQRGLTRLGAVDPGLIRQARAFMRSEIFKESAT
jgi:hypothetical protein